MCMAYVTEPACLHSGDGDCTYYLPCEECLCYDCEQCEAEACEIEP